MQRRYPLGDIKILWALAAGHCSFPGCHEICIAEATSADEAAAIGDVAHIVAHSPNGPRGDPDFPPDALDTYANWILLCPTHHRVVDAQPESYDSATLRRWKAQREAWVAGRLKAPAEFPMPRPRRTEVTVYRVAKVGQEPWATSVPYDPVYRRWADPLGQYGVCYAADNAAAAIAESTSMYRPAPGLLERMSKFFGEPVTEQSLGLDSEGIIRRSLEDSVLAEANVVGAFADFDDHELRRYVEERLASITGLNVRDTSFPAEARWTQEASRALYEAGGWDGVVYPSRIAPGHRTYALFDCATIVPIGERPALSL
jgi:hypothetical protein